MSREFHSWRRDIAAKLKYWLVLHFCRYRVGQERRNGIYKSNRQKNPCPFLKFGGKASNCCPRKTKRVRSEAFVEDFLQVGDIARCADEFCKKSIQSESVLGTDKLKELFSEIEQLHCRQWRELLDTLDLMNLVAYGVRGISLSPPDTPSVSILASSKQQMTWQQLADKGLMNLHYCQGNYYVRIPSIAIRMCSSLGIRNDRTHAQTAFLKALTALTALPSTDADSWQKWEIFGAYFHCFRIDSLLLRGITSCPFSTICPLANTDT